MSTILSLAPQNVWKHFYSLTQIPRPSGHMEKVTGKPERCNSSGTHGHGSSEE